MEVQLRNHDDDTWTLYSIKEAFEAAEQDPEIWKISWDDLTTEGHDRIRLVRYDIDGRPHWLYDPMQRHMDYAEAVFNLIQHVRWIP